MKNIQLSYVSRLYGDPEERRQVCSFARVPNLRSHNEHYIVYKHFFTNLFWSVRMALQKGTQ